MAGQSQKHLLLQGSPRFAPAQPWVCLGAKHFLETLRPSPHMITCSLSCQVMGRARQGQILAVGSCTKQLGCQPAQVCVTLWLDIPLLSDWDCQLSQCQIRMICQGLSHKTLPDQMHQVDSKTGANHNMCFLDCVSTTRTWMPKSHNRNCSDAKYFKWEYSCNFKSQNSSAIGSKSWANYQMV